MNTPLELTLTKIVPASTETVFNAWLDPKDLAQFMRPAPGMGAPTVEVDGKVGGKFLITMKAGEQELPHRGEYKEITPFRRIVFTWRSGHTVADSTVTLSFRPIDDNKTELTLHHCGFPSPESRDDHQGGWTVIVDRLVDSFSSPKMVYRTHSTDGR